MNGNYPDDADFEDMFDISETELSIFLKFIDDDMPAEAIEFGNEYFSYRVDLSDVAEWWGRTLHIEPEVSEYRQGREYFPG